MARASADSQIRFAAQAFLLEVAFLMAASFCSIGYRSGLLEISFQPFASDRLDGARDGHTECRCPETRNPGSDDNGPDTNDHGHRRGLFARKRQQPEIGEKGWVGRRNVFGCGVGCGRHTLLDLSGLVAWDRDLRLCAVRHCFARVRTPDKL